MNRNNAIDNVISDLFIKVLKHKKNNCGHKPIYDNKIFIKAFIKRLRTSNTWKLLEDEFKISDTHLNRKYLEWCSRNIFKKVFNLFLKEYKCYIDFDEVYIDSTILLNKYGYRHTTGINRYEAKKHRSNKLSCLVSKNGIPLGIKLSNSSVHDIKLLLDTLPKRTYFTTLIGDKAYISKDYKKYLKRNRRIDMITETRKNQKKQVKVDIKSRIAIEHFNSLLKQNKAINTRYDKDIRAYEAIIYLGCVSRGLNVIFKFLYDL